MTGRTPARAAKLAAATLAASAGLALAAGSAFAESEVVYNNLPAMPLPGNVVSLAYEATQTSQFGGSVELAGVDRKGGSVTAGMSSWACQLGSWTGTPECLSERGARFEWPLTLRIYQEEPSGEPGALVASVTKVAKIPYRPSESRMKCIDTHGEPTGAWYSRGVCYHGKYFKVIWSVGKIHWPSKAIISVSYNTSDYGSEPQRPKPCNSESGGCPYDSLNMGLSETSPTVGTDPQPNDAYQDSVTAENFCDGGTGGTGVFRLDAGCWAPYQPLFLVKTTP